MALRVRRFSFAEAGKDPSENDDAYECSTDAADDTTTIAAVADGATQSVFAGKWARLLVASLCTDGFPAPEELNARLPELQRIWREALPSEGLPWYTREKLKKGAYAALVGVMLRPGEAGSFRALAIGDCCLFHVRESETPWSFPLASAGAFDGVPDLLSSIKPVALDRVLCEEREWRPGDLLMLASDAVAAWLLGGHEGEVPRWRRASAIATDDAFRELVTSERTARRMQNDDSTLIVIEDVLHEGGVQVDERPVNSPATSGDS